MPLPITTNPRKGTKAYSFPGELSEEEKLKRLERVIDLQRKISRELKKEKVGNVEKVLVEGVSKKRI